MSDAYSVGFKDGAAAGYKLAIEDMKLDKKPQIMKKYEGDYAVLEASYAALREAVAWERECEDMENYLRAKDTRIWLSSRSEWWASRVAARAAVDAIVKEL